MFGRRGRRILIVLIIVVVGFTAYQYVPAYFAAFQFDDFVRQEVKYAGTSRKTVDAVRTNILQKAQELGIPLTKKDVSITKRGASYTVDVDYRWPIDMKLYQHVLTFHTSQIGEIFDNASD
jgi:hypothetical protein